MIEVIKVEKMSPLAKQYCNLDLPLQVLKTPAGWYLGTFDEEGPVSRDSEYFPSEEAAQEALDTDGWTQRLHP